jgi:hypothetical protein
MIRYDSTEEHYFSEDSMIDDDEDTDSNENDFIRADSLSDDDNDHDDFLPPPLLRSSTEEEEEEEELPFKSPSSSFPKSISFRFHSVSHSRDDTPNEDTNGSTTKRARHEEDY